MNNSYAYQSSLKSSLETGQSPSNRLLSATLAVVASSVSVAAPSALANVPLPSPPAPVASWQPHAAVSSFAEHSAAINQSSLHSGAMMKSTFTGRVHSAQLLPHVAVVSGGGSLNLTSTALSYLAGNLANFHSLTIDVGGRQETVNLNTKLTGAEVIAVEQVLNTGSQSLILSTNGAATGGTVSLNSNLLTALDTSLGGSISSLTIARGVEVVDSLSLLSLSGGLTNYGTIATAAGAGGSTDKISAATIVNASGAAIDSYTAKSSSDSSLVAADPSLSATTSLTNNGTIGSAGCLTISSPVVYNVASTGSAAPSIRAAHDININTQNLTNGGVIASTGGNVNLSSTGALAVAGTGGTLQAGNGNINFATTNGDINVTGGNLLSQQVNFTAGKGNIEANVDQVTGVVNASGNEVHINASSQSLDLGRIEAVADPTISNTATIDIQGGSFVTKGAALSIVSGQDIVGAGGVLNTSSLTAAGGALTLVAGAAYYANAGNTIKVTGASGTGGMINLAGAGAVTAIVTGGNAEKTEAGGSITMVAFAGSETGSGTVTTPSNVAINASGTTVGSSVGAAGNVTIIAGSTSSTGYAISTGVIIGKTVTLDTSTPFVGGGVTFSSTGAQSGTFTPKAISNTASINVGNVTGTLDINSQGTAAVNNSITALTLGAITLGKTGVLEASNTAAGASGAIAVDGVITGGNILITSNGTITVTKTITAQEALTIDGGVGTSSSSANAVVVSAAVIAPTINIGLNVNDSGSIALDAVIGTLTGATITQTVNVIAGSSGTGGNITGTAYVYAANQVTLGASGSIGTAGKPIETDTPILSVGTSVANHGGAYITQKGNLSLANSNSDNLVLKVTGNLDVTGIIDAPAMSLTSTGTTTIDGKITNTYYDPGNPNIPSAGVILITSAKAFTIDPQGLISTTSDTQPVTINVTGTGTLNGAIAVQSLILKISEALTIGQTSPQSTVILNDGSDSISSKGIITINAQIHDTALSVTTTEAFNIVAGAGIAVSNTSNINALTITNAGALAGNIAYTATGSGDSFKNETTGIISGTTVTVNTTSSSGIIDNLGVLSATPPTGSTAVPTLNLIARTVDNTNEIEAQGNNGVNGALNISSPTTLTIIGNTGTFGSSVSNNYGSVSLTANGNITVGSTISNPFSNLTAANNLGSFSVSTPDIFTSPLTGISVTTNAQGTVGGAIAITAAGLAYNGSTTPLTQAFALTTVGQNNSAVALPVYVDLTGSKGLTIGALAGDYTVDVFGFAPTSTTTLTTSQALVVNVGSLVSPGTSLALTGTHSLLIDGFLDQTAAGTSVALTTSSTSNFLVGGATSNGVSGSGGQEIAANSLTINAPATIVLAAGTASSVGSTLNATDGINLYAKGLTVDAYANIVSTGATSTGLTLEAKTGALNFTNLNGSVDTQPGVSTINLIALAGTLTVSSGTANGTQTVLSVGTGTYGPGGAASGGTININAESISYGSGGLLLDATNGVNGGVVNIDLAGSTAAKIGTGAGNISADLASTTTAGNGVFSLTTAGSITGTNLYSTSTQRDSAIDFGVAGSGKLILVGDGTNSKISLKEITGIDLNTLSLTSHSTTSFVMSGATGGNGIIDGAINTPAASITAGVLYVSNTGEVDLSNVVLSTTAAQQITINSITSISLSQQPSLTVGSVASFAGNTGGMISLTAPVLLLSGSGLALKANGGSSSGGSISVTTTSTTTPLTVGAGAGQISFDVSDTANNKGGAVTVVSGNSLTASAAGLNFGSDNNVGSFLSLTSGVSSNLLFNNAGTLTGLNYGSVAFISGGSSAFLLAGATVNGLGGTGTNSALNAGALKIISTGFATIDLTGQNLTVHSLSLSTGGAVNLAANQAISVVADGTTGSGAASGNGGIINITAGSILSPSGTSNTLSALSTDGNGGSITINTGGFGLPGGLNLLAYSTGNGTGGSVTVNNTSSAALTVGAGALFVNVANASGFNGGSASVTNGGALTVDASSSGINLGSNYGASGPSLSLVSTASTILVTFGSASVNNFSNLTLGSSSSQALTLGGANVDGITDNSLLINATKIDIFNTGGMLANGTLAGLSGTSSITLDGSTGIGTSGAGINIASSPSVSVTTGGGAYLNTSGTTDFAAANVTGSLNINGTGGSLTVGPSGSSTANFTAGSFVIGYVGATGNTATLTLGSMAATGTSAGSGIAVTSNAKSLAVSKNASITTVDGNISLDNSSTLGVASIAIGSDVLIHASSEIGDINDGNVYISMGSGNYTAAAGVTPSGATVNTTGNGAVTFGSTTNTSGTITASTGDVFSGLDRNLSFNTDTFGASAITVGSGVVITADPPAASAAQAAAGSVPTSSAIANSLIGLNASASVSVLSTPANALVTSLNSTVSSPDTAPISTLASSTLMGGASTSVATVSAANSSAALAGVNNSSVWASALSTSSNSTLSTSTVRSSQIKRLTGGVSNVTRRTLEYGPLLLSPENNQTVATPFGSVNVVAGSVALIISSDQGLAVYNLHDDHKNAVTVTNDDGIVSLAPGRSFIIAKSAARSFEQANPAPFVRYRQVSESAKVSHGHVYQADFDVVSMLHGLPGVNALLESDSAAQRKTATNMLKTAAILTQISSKNEPYALYLTPSITACAMSAQH